MNVTEHIFMSAEQPFDDIADCYRGDFRMVVWKGREERVSLVISIWLGE